MLLDHLSPECPLLRYPLWEPTMRGVQQATEHGLAGCYETA
jgi:hypothetical protein